MTNADKIRNMTDEELDAFFPDALCDNIQDTNKEWCEKHSTCSGCTLEWLKHEVEE